ncbi:MAG: agmatinase [Thermoleophilaceae bacterium]
MLDPTERWRRYHGHDWKASWAGLLTFAELPYTEDAAELEGVDVAVVGAPMDHLVTSSPGTRLGPRAIRAANPTTAYHLETRLDWSESLRVIDYGDAPVVPTDAAASHRAIEDTVGEVARAGAIPIVLGGDHSITEPDIRACAAVHGPLGLIHFDAHTDSAATLYGQELSHGTPMYRLVEQGHVTPERYVQIGLRGWWPEEAEFRWQAERGITSFLMPEVTRLGIDRVVERAVEIVGEGPAFLTVDIDVLDPAFAPGTGTPEPGGMTPSELFSACRTVAAQLQLVGVDVVEVAPTGLADRTALVADRIVRDVLSGIALGRAAR